MKARKAVVAAAIPVLSAGLLWATTGEISQAELSVALSGLITAGLVWLVPNDKPERPQIDPAGEARQRIN
jgi:hypothetical protein